MKRICLIALVLVAGCISNEIRLTASDNGNNITLYKGQTLIITLEANPTTGYTWEVEDVDTNIIRQVGEIEFQPGSSAVGAGGLQTVRLEAVNAGKTPLRLVYHRTWEKDVEPQKTFSVQVVVK